MNFRVFVTRRIPISALHLLRETCDVDLWDSDLPPSPEILLEKTQTCDGLLALLTDRIDRAFLDRCPKLRVVSNMAVGYDNIDIPAATQRGIVIGNTPNVLTETTADFTFALLLAIARRIPEGIDFVHAGYWQTWGPLLLMGHDVHHATLGLVGLGRIGAEVAKRAKGFDMRVLYTSHARRPSLESTLGIEYADFETVLRASDFVSLHTPLTHETRHLINRAALATMKQTAYIINTARGSIIETEALLEALTAGTIAGAALDVTDPEPIPANHPLNQLPNCIIVPHIASASVATRIHMAEIAARNIIAVLTGQPMVSCVNPSARNPSGKGIN